MRARVLPFLLCSLAAPALAQQPAIPAAQEALKDYQVERGFFTTWRKDQQVCLEVPANLLDQPFLLATSIAGGPQYAGFQWGTTVCAWQRLDRKLLLVEREVRYRVKDRRPVTEVVKRTYTDRLLQAAPIVALNGGNPIIDLVALCAGQAPVFFGPLAAGLDSGVVQVGKLKAFPQNLELGLTLPDKQREGRFTTLAYSFSALPAPNSDRYQPRPADDRVGFFLTAVKDFTDEAERGDRFVRWVHRWKLEKADGSLPRSPVREPIVFYVEDTVPYRFRQAVAEGILEWNKAFEAIGLQGVMVVRQQTDTEFQDLDPEDVRYNFFRWIVSERSFAMGPSRVNPWTGQILDADIVFDESMVRVYLRDWEREIKEGPKQGLSPGLRALLESDPRRWDFARAEGGEPGPEGDTLASGPDVTGCGLGTGLSHELGLAALALDLLAAEGGAGGYPDEFIAAVVKDVVMHEVGHTLGLRHNFKASSWRPLSEINSAARPAELCASVMDYNPLNVVPQGGTQGNYTNRTIGPYDFWAIKYGYELLPDEAGGLAATVACVGSPQYAYATDEDTTGPDPTATRWDLGQDPLEFAAQRIALSRALLGSVVERLVPKGASWAEARRAVDMLLGEQQRAGQLAARWVGGQLISRHHRGDAGAADPVTPVPVAVQRRALQLVCQQLLRAGNLDLPADLLRQLGKEHWRHWGAAGAQAPHAYPYYERVQGIQRWALFSLLNPDTLRRLIENEALSGEDDRLGVAEVLDQVSLAVLGDLLLPGPLPLPATPGKPAIPTAQRALQRAYVDELIAMHGEGPGGPTPLTARNLARLELARILAELQPERDRQPLDAESRAHLLDLALRIERAREAQWSVPAPFGR